MRKKLMYGVTAIAMAASILTGCSESKKEFPSKEITVVVPWNPGGTNDLMARALQPVFKEKFNDEYEVSRTRTVRSWSSARI